MSRFSDLTQVCENCLCDIDERTRHATHETLCERCGRELDALSNTQHVLKYITSPAELYACPICGKDLLHIGARNDALCTHCHLWILQGNTNVRDRKYDYVTMEYSDGHVYRYDADGCKPYFDKAQSVAEVFYSQWNLRDIYTFEEYQARVSRDNTSTKKSKNLDYLSENQNRLDKLGI